MRATKAIESPQQPDGPPTQPPPQPPVLQDATDKIYLGFTFDQIKGELADGVTAQDINDASQPPHLQPKSRHAGSRATTQHLAWFNENPVQQAQELDRVLVISPPGSMVYRYPGTLALTLTHHARVRFGEKGKAYVTASKDDGLGAFVKSIENMSAGEKGPLAFAGYIYKQNVQDKGYDFFSLDPVFYTRDGELVRPALGGMLRYAVDVDGKIYDAFPQDENGRIRRDERGKIIYERRENEEALGYLVHLALPRKLTTRTEMDRHLWKIQSRHAYKAMHAPLPIYDPVYDGYLRGALKALEEDGCRSRDEEQVPRHGHDTQRLPSPRGMRETPPPAPAGRGPTPKSHRRTTAIAGAGILIGVGALGMLNREKIGSAVRNAGSQMDSRFRFSEMHNAIHPGNATEKQAELLVLEKQIAAPYSRQRLEFNQQLIPMLLEHAPFFDKPIYQYTQAEKQAAFDAFLAEWESANRELKREEPLRLVSVNTTKDGRIITIVYDKKNPIETIEILSIVKKQLIAESVGQSIDSDWELKPLPFTPQEREIKAASAKAFQR